MSARAKTTLLGASLLVVSGACAVGCRTPVTQVVLTFRSCRPATLYLHVTGADGEMQDASYQVTSFPYQVVLAPRDQDVTRRHFRVEAELGDGTGARYGSPAVYEGDYEPRVSLDRDLTVFDPGCGDGGLGMDAGPPVDDAGGRVHDSVLVAYDFSEGDGASVTDCGPRGYDLTSAGSAAIAWSDGATYTAGFGRSADFVPAWSEVVTSGELTVEMWLTIGDFLETNDRAHLLALVDSGNGRQEVVMTAFAGGPDWLLWASVSTGYGDSNGRPFIEARLSYSTTPVHLVFVHRDLAGLDTASEELWVDGELQAPALALDGVPFPDSGPSLDGGAGWRRGAIHALEGPTAHLEVGDAETWGGLSGPPTQPDGSERFTGRYHMLVLYSRALEPDEIRAHAARTHLDNPCP